MWNIFPETMQTNEPMESLVLVDGRATGIQGQKTQKYIN